MMAVIFATVTVAALGGVATWAGVRIARAATERFDALLPQRMVDYCGFVPAQAGRD